MSSNVERTGIEVLSFDECRELLASTQVGRIAFVSAGDIDVFPVNYAMVGHQITIRTAVGEKLEAALMEQPVSFEIDHFDTDAHTGWSVLAKGVAHPVEDEDRERLEASGLRPWAGTDQRDHWIQIRPHELTGRRVWPPAEDD